MILGVGLAFLKELEAGCSAGRLYADSLATALAVHLVKSYASVEPVIRNYKGGLPQYKLRRALEFINDNLAEDLSLASVAAAANSSESHFARLFKQSTGRAPYQYVTERRVECAKHLLATTDLPLTEIALLVGFSSHSHFTAVFRKLTGITPKAYRQHS